MQNEVRKKLKLSTRGRLCVDRCLIQLGPFENWTAAKMLALRQCGITSVAEVIVALRAFGVQVPIDFASKSLGRALLRWDKAAMMFESRQDEARDALKFVDNLVKQCPNLKGKLEHFDGYFVAWDEIVRTCQQAWPQPRGYGESPLELIAYIINERDESRTELAALKAAQSKS